MKSLVEFIMEAKSRQEIRIEVKDIDKSDEFLSELESMLRSKDIYQEKIDNGLKFAIQGENKEKYQEILDILKNWEPGAEKLAGPISKLEEWIIEEPEETIDPAENKEGEDE